LLSRTGAALMAGNLALTKRAVKSGARRRVTQRLDGYL
jgi:hypothetical protein